MGHKHMRLIGISPTQLACTSPARHRFDAYRTCEEHRPTPSRPRFRTVGAVRMIVMTRPLSYEERHARFILELLVGDPAGPALESPDWSVLGRLARAHGVLVRVADRLAALGVSGPPGFVAAAERERARARAAVEVLQHIHLACARHGIAWMVPKAIQRYPDVGDDLDLLVFAPGEAMDRFVLEGLQVIRERPSLANRVAGSRRYTVVGAEALGLVLDIRHDRVGSAGQHAAFARVLARNGHHAVLDGTELLVPSPEDQLVLQGLEKVAGRRSFHLCDLLQTITLLGMPRLDWDYVLTMAQAQGGRNGLSCYLHYADEAHTRLVGRPLLTAEQGRALAVRGWGHTRLREAGFSFPAVRVTGRVHGGQLGQALGRADWDTALRLSLWPFAIVGARLGRLGRAEAAPPSHADAAPNNATRLAGTERGS